MRLLNLPVVVLCFFTALLLLPAGVSAQHIGPANGGFEQLSAEGTVVGWRLDSENSKTEVIVRPDTVLFRDGVGSISLSVGPRGAATFVSDPLDLRVGHLYSLSGWIKTDGVFSDPTTRYPTAVPACLTMASFPFTNHSPTVGGTKDWTYVQTLFIATTSEDRVRLHLGYNGTASGTAYFDDIRVAEVNDIGDFIAPETVRWFGDAYRYDDRGWIFVHIEGEPYERGLQYGALLSDEISDYITRLGTQDNVDDPEEAWEMIRFETDALFLRGYDEEYLTEMRGTADGARHSGGEVFGREIDFLDIVAINSVIDLGQLHDALEVTPHSLSGEGFLDVQEEILIDAEQHKCSAFAATGPATADGQVVFGQIFMWSGYTGVHWNVICDLEPAKGHRLVYHTFPGGIHSGADFYINDAGIVIGETTVSQTPYEPDSTPQSNRIRKAAQYASSIDEVEAILWNQNNGMYTNDWPMADIKTGEVAILLLGTHSKKMWRTSEDMAPFGTPGFLWANNNNRDPEVRKEYAAHFDDRPFDMVFSPWNRDLAFNEYYDEYAGAIDAMNAVELWASSPINRAHACDGKITTTEMASELVFLAHHGKVTLREKFPQKGYRIMPDLPGATPHLSLGYSTASPIFITNKLKASRRVSTDDETTEADSELDLESVENNFSIDSDRLWRQTVYPASDGENWFVSGSAAYWRLLKNLEDEPNDAAEQLGLELARATNRWLYTVSREDDLAASDAHRAYDRYGPYVLPRIKGLFCLHQLRLLLGTEPFLTIMREVHDRFGQQEITTAEFVAVAEEVSGRPLEAFMRQWINRTGLPKPNPSITLEEQKDERWTLSLTVEQEGEPYLFLTHVAIEGEDRAEVRLVEVDGDQTVDLELDFRPSRVLFNVFDDVPVARPFFYTWANLIDDFHNAVIVYGTSRQIEAQHTLARRWQETVANTYIEILPPLVKDSELGADQARANDLIVLGSARDNSLIKSLAPELPMTIGRGFFEWQGETYAEPNDGLFIVLPNPFNAERVLYLVLANSALQLHQMTKTYHRDIPSWALFEDDEIVDRGNHQRFDFKLEITASGG